VRGGTFCQKVLHNPIVFTLHGSIESFSEASERRKTFLSLLIEKLSLSYLFEPVIVSVTPGSVIVQLVFFQHVASTYSIDQVILRLKANFRSGEFKSVGATGLKIGEETVLPTESATISLLAIIMISILFFLMFCMLSLLTIKKRLDANKVIPFSHEKSSVVVSVVPASSEAASNPTPNHASS
jgi:hypothetical protein